MEKVILGRLHELRPSGSNTYDGGHLRDGFSGKLDHENSFSILSPDRQGYLTIQGRELLTRFLSLNQKAQYYVVSGVKEAMKKHEVSALRIEVPWGTQTNRTLVFRNSEDVMRMSLA